MQHIEDRDVKVRRLRCSRRLEERILGLRPAAGMPGSGPSEVLLELVRYIMLYDGYYMFLWRGHLYSWTPSILRGREMHIISAKSRLGIRRL